MAGEMLWRVLGQLTGLGSDKQVEGRAVLTLVPTKCFHAVQPIATTPTQLDVLKIGGTESVISGELFSLFVKPTAGKVHVLPHATAVVTTQCLYIEQDDFNLYTYETTISNVPSFQAVTAGTQMEYLLAAVS